MINPFWALMSIVCVILSISSPFWWLNIISLWCAYVYIKWAIEDS